MQSSATSRQTPHLNHLSDIVRRGQPGDSIRAVAGGLALYRKDSSSAHTGLSAGYSAIDARKEVEQLIGDALAEVPESATKWRGVSDSVRKIQLAVQSKGANLEVGDIEAPLEVISRHVKGAASEGVPRAEGKFKLSPNGLPAIITVGEVEFSCAASDGKSTADASLLSCNSQAEIRVYTSRSGRELVLKVLTGPDPERNFNDLTREASVHRQAMNGGDDVLRMADIVRLSDGRVGLLMERAPNGTLHGLLKILAKLPNPPKNIGLLLRTVARDCVAGVLALRVADVSHQDFKAVNMFITKDGKLVVADFGAGHCGNRKPLDIRAFNDQNPSWHDALASRAVRDIQDGRANVQAPFAKEIDAALNNFKTSVAAIRSDGSLSGKIKRSARLEHAEDEKDNKLKDIRRREAAAVQAYINTTNMNPEVSGHAADAWDCGLMLYEIYFGATPLVQFDKSTNEVLKVPTVDNQLAFLRMTPKQRAEKLFGGDNPPDVPDDIKNLILGLMSPDTMDRDLALIEALDSDSFQISADEERAARAEIARLTSGS